MNHIPPPPRSAEPTPAPPPPTSPPPPHPLASPQPPPQPVGATTTPPPLGPPEFVSPEHAKPSIVRNDYDHERARWGLGDMFVSLGVFFVGSFALILLIVVFSDRDEFLQRPWLLVGVVGPHALLLAHLYWVSRTKGQGFASDYQLRLQWSDAGLGLGLFLAGLIGAGIVAVIITQILGEPPTASAIELAQESGEDGLTIWLYLFAILGATFVPVVEELIYRGLFWSALEKRGMRPWTILVITSAVFAIIHLEPVRTAVLFVVGLAIGVGRLVTGRVGASIAAHVFVNAMAMTATLAQLA